MKMRFVAMLSFVALIISDQLSKMWVEANLPFQQPVEILPLFSLLRTHNTGVAFSMLTWLGNSGLIFMSTLIIIFISILMLRLQSGQVVAKIGFLLVIAGAIGNLIDRIRLEYVVDFFMFHTESWSFAVFNMADIFITLGAATIIFDELRSAICHYRANSN